MDTREAVPLNEEERLYRSLTPTSYEYFVEGREYLPGADSRSPLFHPPYPVVLEEGEGCWLLDVDGNELLERTNGLPALALTRRGGLERRAGALESGAAEVLSTRGPVEEIVAAVERLIG